MTAATRGAAIVAVSGTLLAGIAAFEGTEFVPYKDIGGVWTVCDGVTGPHVIPGKVYTRSECRALTSGAVARHGAEIRRCIGDEHLTQPIYEAVTSLAYNVGSPAVCKGSIPRLLRAQDVTAACRKILEYDKVRINGVLRSCRDPQWDCRGVALRRDAESRWCLGEAPV